jgi:S1-C subfamily serine protease
MEFRGRRWASKKAAGGARESIIALFGALLMIAGCAHQKAVVSSGVPSLLSPQLQRQIREVMESVVEVVHVREYRIEQFSYEVEDGHFMHDPQNPTGFRLRGGSALYGVIFDREIIKAFGAGLLLLHNDRNALILTSSHLCTAQDTILTYYPSHYQDGRPSPDSLPKPLFSRAVTIRTELGVRHQNQAIFKAELVANDERNDIALLSTTWRPGLAAPYASSFAYEKPADVGEVALAIGFPDEIKQVTFGMVGGAPYPRNFSLGILGRFGFSGCPVLLVRQDNMLTLAGIGRGAPVSEFSMIVPPAEFVNGYYLQPEDLTRLRVRRTQQINYGSLYCVDIRRIGEFISANFQKLRASGFTLPDRFLAK